jgi:hypothetical protein
MPAGSLKVMETMKIFTLTAGWSSDDGWPVLPS